MTPLAPPSSRRVGFDWITPTIWGVFGVLALAAIVVMHGSYWQQRHTLGLRRALDDGNHAAAIRHLEAFLTKTPDHTGRLRQLATEFLWDNQPDAARVQLERLHELKPEMNLDFEWGWCLLQMGESDKSQAPLARVLKRKPKDPGVNFCVGRIALEQERYDRAGRAFLLASLDPDWHERAKPWRAKLAEAARTKNKASVTTATTATIAAPTHPE